MTTPKPEFSMSSVKKKIITITNQLEQQYKSNLFAYKNKYYQLTDAIYSLYINIKKCHHTILKYQKSKKKTDQNEQDSELEGGIGKDEKCGDDIDPFSLIQFCKQFCSSTVAYCSEYRKKQEEIKDQMNKLFHIETNAHFLQALAKKNLQNYNLNLRVQELQKILEYKAMQCKLAQKTTNQYQKKFKQCQKDFDSIVISIANILKDCEISESELRQENRLQKQFIQTQKIEFERYKSDFKLRPSYQQKANRIKKVLQKQFQNRETMLIKQTQKIVQQKLRSKLLSAQHSRHKYIHQR